jgi:hypothetical protein
MSWLWALIPKSAKIWVIVAVVLAIVSLTGLTIFKIQRWGYERCENKYTSAILDLRDSSRKEIIEAEKKYDDIRKKIIAVRGSDDTVGPRVVFAIDSLPGSAGGQ